MLTEYLVARSKYGRSNLRLSFMIKISNSSSTVTNVTVFPVQNFNKKNFLIISQIILNTAGFKVV